MKIYTEAEAIQYTKKQKYFPLDAELLCKNIQEEADSEGMINLVYRVYDLFTGKAVIFKQTMPQMLAVIQQKGAKYAPEMPVDRLSTEIKMLTFLRTIDADIVPEVYLVDYEEGVSLMEDLSHLDLMRFTVKEGVTYPDFGVRIGTVLAQLHFLTSRFALCDADRKNLMDYFSSSAWDRVDDFFLERCPLCTDYIHMAPCCDAVRKRTMADPRIQSLLKHLSEVYRSRICLAHNDVHTSNILIDQNEIKLIDSELAGFSAPYPDLGRLSGSFITNYISWTYRRELPLAKRKEMQAYDIQMLCDLLNTYKRTLEKLWEAYGVQENLQAFYTEILRDTLLYATGWTMIKVASDVYQSPDIACIKDQEQMAALQLKTAEMAADVWMNIEDYNNMDDFIKTMAGYFQLR